MRSLKTDGDTHKRSILIKHRKIMLASVRENYRSNKAAGVFVLTEAVDTVQTLTKIGGQLFCLDRAWAL